MHSHLLPGIDDGVKDLDEMEIIIRELIDVGYTKVITTPHVISDLYRNTPEIILEKLEVARQFIAERKLNITIDAAAEYYLDETLYHKLKNNEKLLTIGGKYVLFETNFITEPLLMKEFIFLASSKGYKLILAHPERYLYLHDQDEKVEDLLARGVYLQVNITSLSGYYSKPAQKLATRLINDGHVHFLGTDCHHMNHVELLKKMQKNKYFEKALTLPLLNNSLT